MATFTKRTNPDGKSLHSSNKYYKTPLNNQLYNTASGGNCVWYAYGRMLEVWSNASAAERAANPWPGFFSNNGYLMVASAKAKGFKTGITPKLGAIISWADNGTAVGSPGHVAFVEDINYNADGSIKNIEISQSGWNVGNMKNQILTPGTGKIGKGAWVHDTNDYFMGFAYNPVTFTKQTSTSASTVTTINKQYMITYNGTMNLRSGPSTSKSIVGSLVTGTIFKATKKSGNWVYTGKGWICLKDSNKTYCTEITTISQKYQVIAIGGMNVRKGAGTHFNSIKTIAKGKKFTATKKCGNWVYSSSDKGWICLKSGTTTYLKQTT